MRYDNLQKRITAIRLKECRNEKGLSYENLAKELSGRYSLKISAAVLKNYEVADEGHAKFETGYGMNIQYLFTLADFYNVSTDYLLGKTDLKSSETDDVAINRRLGLSDKTIANFTYLHRAGIMSLFNAFFEHETFLNLAQRVWGYILDYAYASQLEKLISQPVKKRVQQIISDETGAEVTVNNEMLSSQLTKIFHHKYEDKEFKCFKAFTCFLEILNSISIKYVSDFTGMIVKDAALLYFKENQKKQELDP